MSNPISSLTRADTHDAAETDASTGSVETGLELDEILDDSEEKPLTEVERTEADADEAANEESSEESEQEERKKGGWGLVALILAALLVGSVAINLKQSRDVATLETQSGELERALASSIERIDSETSRANGAEAALERVDSAVDLVNERVLGLQEALDGLREATVR